MVPKYLFLALLVGVVALTIPSDAGYKPPEPKPPTPESKPPVPKLPPPEHKPPTPADEKQQLVDRHKPHGPKRPPGHHLPPVSDTKDVESGHGYIPQPKPKPYVKPPPIVKPPGPHKPPHKPPSPDHLN